MDSPLTLGLAIALGVALVAVGVLLVLLLRGRAATRAEVAAARTDAAALREQVDGLAARLDAREARSPLDDDGAPAYVITDAGSVAAPDLAEHRPMVSDRVVLNAALGEPLVRAVALGHGVRRALRAETRHRIRFEMRREAKRARKQRRREMRDAWREARVRRPAPSAPDPGTRAA